MSWVACKATMAQVWRLCRARHKVHTFASLLIEAREDLPYIQHQLGHHSAAFTLRVYGHLMPRQGRRGVDALDDASIRNPRATAHPLPSLS